MIKPFLTVFPLPSLSSSSINQTYEVGSTAVLECSSFGGPNNAFQWQLNGLDIIGETQSTLTLPNVQASTGGMYTCVVTNAAGSDDISTFLYVSPYFINQPMDTQASNGTPATLLCEAGAFPSPEYQWGRVDGEHVRGGIATDGTLFSFNPVMFGDEGEYYCTVSVSALESSIRSQAVLSGKIYVSHFGTHDYY